MLRSLRLFAIGSGLALSIAAAPHEADACGGCLHGPSDTVTAVTSHRMVVAIHANDSILWDQVRYSGNPSDFAWVLPVWGNVQVELASADFFDTLDATTTVSVQAPFVNLSCPGTGGGGIGCGASAGLAPRDFSNSSDASAGADGGHVTVLHEMVVGPYETVTLRGTDANSLTNWLAMNSYVIPTAIAPVIQYYVDHGMDFVAMRLRPGQGVQAMQPVRIRYSTSNMVLPLRMVAAGVTDKVGITLWVFGNGRYEPANFGSGRVLNNDVVWDWTTESSNYREAFDQTIMRLGGRAWITEFANSATSVRQPDSTDGRADFALATGASNMTFPSDSMTITRLTQPAGLVCP